MNKDFNLRYLKLHPFLPIQYQSKYIVKIVLTDDTTKFILDMSI